MITRMSSFKNKSCKPQKQVNKIPKKRSEPNMWHTISTSKGGFAKLSMEYSLISSLVTIWHVSLLLKMYIHIHLFLCIHTFHFSESICEIISQYIILKLVHISHN